MGNTALLVVDVQNAMVEDKPYEVELVIANIKRLVDECRKNSIEVIYVQHSEGPGEPLEEGSLGWDIYSEIGPMPGERVFCKHFNSAFKETGLKQYLEEKGIERLVLTGMQTEYCIDTSCRVAFEYGFKLIIPEMTNTTYDNDSMTARQIYEYHNWRIFKNRFGIVEPVEAVLQRIL